MGKFIQNDKKSSQSSSIISKIKQTIRRERSASNTRSNSQNSNSARSSSIAVNDEEDSRRACADDPNVEKDDDDTNSDMDDNQKTLNRRYRSNRTIENFPCRDLFKLETKGKQQLATCKTCNEAVKMSSNSDGNLRTHLAYKHEKHEYLTPSQLKVWNVRKGKIENKVELKLTKDEKQEINNKIVDSIIEDSRTFNDFTKTGIKKLFDYLKPGYKPPSSKTIRKMIKRR